MANSEIEIWKDIPGSDGLYRVSNYGNVYSVGDNPKSDGYKTPRILIPVKNNKGYLRVSILENGIRKRFYIHRLVALAFIPNPENKPFVNHIDNDPSNNHVDNLEWATQYENIRHCVKQNRNAKGSKNGMFGKMGYAKKVVNNTTGEIFKSVEAAATHLEISRKHLINQLKGKVKNNCGFAYSN